MKNQSNDIRFYVTSDLGLAVYLSTVGQELIKTAPQGNYRNRLNFYFKLTEGTESLAIKYMNETGQAPAKKLFENYRALRALAFAETNNLR